MSFLRKMFRGMGKPRTELFKPPAPPSQAGIAEAEKALNLIMPPSFTRFMSTIREMRLPLCARFYWIGTAGSTGTDDIVRANQVEHEESSSPLPSFLVAFYNDGMGNQVCFDTRTRSKDGEYPVVFWDHELGLHENLEACTRATESFESAGVVAASFPEWLNKLHERIE